MTMTTTDPLADLRKEFRTPALQRAQIVELFRRCGLGGIEFYKTLKASGTLKPLANLPGAKQARYSREAVFTILENALKEA